MNYDIYKYPTCIPNLVKIILPLKQCYKIDVSDFQMLLHISLPSMERHSLLIIFKIQFPIPILLSEFHSYAASTSGLS